MRIDCWKIDGPRAHRDYDDASEHPEVSLVNVDNCLVITLNCKEWFNLPLAVVDKVRQFNWSVYGNDTATD